MAPVFVSDLLKGLAFVAAAGGLTACGGTGGSGIGGGGASGARALSYAPAYGAAGDTLASNASSGGISGVVAFADILNGTTSLGSVKLRMNADKTQAYVSVNGGSEIALARESVNSTFYSFRSGDRYLLINLDTDQSQMVNFGIATNNTMGSVGLETPVDVLPTSPTRYTGLYAGGSYVPNSFVGGENLTGTVYLDVNYAGSTFTGGFGIEPNTGAVTGDFVGQVSGGLSGNGLAGTLALNGGDYTGTLDFAAKHLGNPDIEIHGAVAGSGTLASDGSARNFAVNFDAD